MAVHSEVTIPNIYFLIRNFFQPLTSDTGHTHVIIYICGSGSNEETDVQITRCIS